MRTPRRTGQQSYAGDFSIILTGDKELDRKLASIAPALQKKAIRQATRKSAVFILRDAKQLVSRDTGSLESSLKVRASPRSRVQQGHGVVSLGTDAVMRGKSLFSGDTYYGAFVEFGTEHMAADPFLRPALYGNESKVKAVFAKELAIGIRKQQDKTAAK